MLLHIHTGEDSPGPGPPVSVTSSALVLKMAGKMKETLLLSWPAQHKACRGVTGACSVVAPSSRLWVKDLSANIFGETCEKPC